MSTYTKPPWQSLLKAGPASPPRQQDLVWQMQPTGLPIEKNIEVCEIACTNWSIRMLHETHAAGSCWKTPAEALKAWQTALGYWKHIKESQPPTEET